MAERAGPGAALVQLQSRSYADKFCGSSEPIHLIGVEFSEEGCNPNALGAMRA